MSNVGSPLMMRFTGCAETMDSVLIDLVSRIQRYLTENNLHPDSWCLYTAPFSWSPKLAKMEAIITIMDMDGDKPSDDYGSWFYHEIETKAEHTEACMMEAIIKATDFMREYGLNEGDCRVISGMRSSGKDDNLLHCYTYVFYCAKQEIKTT